MHDAGGDYAGTTEYIYDGTKLIAENRSGTWLYYFYDANGTVTGMYYNNVLYYFRKNLQGDITGIYNASGNIIAQYEYTPYGAPLTITNGSGTDVSTNATHIANINPFRYRGYYYDTETELYYLITRYYDPVVGRFLNADAIVGANCSFVGYNLFAYCDNNPIMYIDQLGLAEEAVLEKAIKMGSTFAAMDGPLPGGDLLGAFVVVVVLLVEAAESGEYNSSFDDDVVPGECKSVGSQDFEYYHDDYQYASDVLTLPSTSSVSVESDSPSESVITKDKNRDPNPYKRPGQKKQEREKREKKKGRDDWTLNPNKRQKPPKHHTPGRDHRKYK